MLGKIKEKNLGNKIKNMLLKRGFIVILTFPDVKGVLF